MTERRWGLRLPGLPAGRRSAPEPQIRAGDAAAPVDHPGRFHAAAWAARGLSQQRPSLHVDAGSCPTEVGIFSGFAPSIYVHRHPPRAWLLGLAIVAGDVTQLPFPDKTVVSLTSLNVVQHVADGDLDEAIKGLKELGRVLGYRGSLYLATAVGRERVHKSRRIFAPETVLRALPHLRLRKFSYVGDDLLLHDDVPFEAAANLKDGCGMFEFERA
jgi:hypothetical protein